MKMKISELSQGTVVRFTAAIEGFGGYAEQGIKAKVVRVEHRDEETLAIEFEYTRFRGENQQYETAAFGVGGLETATEAGVVPDGEVLFFSSEQDASELVEVVSPPPRPSPRST